MDRGRIAAGRARRKLSDSEFRTLAAVLAEDALSAMSRLIGFITKFVILSAAKSPRDRTLDGFRIRGFFAALRMTNKGVWVVAQFGLSSPAGAVGRGDPTGLLPQRGKAAPRNDKLYHHRSLGAPWLLRGSAAEIAKIALVGP
jgi:hypothetical protein